MPVAAGLMQRPLVNVYITTSTLDSITPDPADCGDALTFDVTVSNTNVSGPDPIGDFSIIDNITNTVLATGSLGPRGAGTAVCPSATGYLELYVQYDGYPNQFMPNTSDITTFGMNLVGSTTTIISPLPGDYYCYTEDFSVTALITSGRGVVPGGNVNFRLYTSATNYIELPSGTVDEFGNATTTIPGSTTLAARSNYLYASFDGYACFTRSATAKGTSGVLIYPTQNDATSLVLSVDGGITFPATDPVTFIGTVTANNLSDPSDGYVNFFATDITGPTTIELGNATPTNGIAELVVPGNTFDPRGTWDLYGQYYTTGDCYANSVQVNLRINPT